MRRGSWAGGHGVNAAYGAPFVYSLGSDLYRVRTPNPESRMDTAVGNFTPIPITSDKTPDQLLLNARNYG